MSDAELLKWFPYAFPFFFVGMWLFVTTMLGLMSGWFSLQQWYPDDGSEEPLLKLRSQSGSMGAGVHLNGCLKLRAYSSGLGIGIWRIFGPFQKPLKVPWSEIDAEPSSMFFVPMVKLHLGKPSNGTLKVSARSWSRLVAAVPHGSNDRRVQVPRADLVKRRSFVGGLFLQWLVATGGAAAIFYFGPRSLNGGSASLPIGVCIGFPAIVIGIGQATRYAREG